MKDEVIVSSPVKVTCRHVMLSADEKYQALRNLLYSVLADLTDIVESKGSNYWTESNSAEPS